MFYLSSFFVFLFILNSCSVKKNNSQTIVNQRQSLDAVYDYFDRYLKGEPVEYKKSCRIKVSEIKKTQNEVWSDWVKANNAFTEEKLIELTPLSEKKSSMWNLPNELEPNALMPYYWGSKGDKPELGYPLYLYLHGSGNKDREWSNGYKFGTQFDDAPSAYFIPQIPNIGNYYRWWQKAKQYAWEKLLRESFVSGNIDANKVYFFGISEGGYGSQRLASFYADYLAAAGPMAGGEPLKNAPVENCRNIGFSLLTGDKDTGFYRNKLTQYVKDEFEKWHSLYPESFVNRIELIPDAGHSIEYKRTTPWLKEFTRNPYPKFVSWENFEMDGLYRTGFYNLFVKQRSNDDDKSRTYYEFRINGNDLLLKVDEVVYKVTELDPQWGIELKFEKEYYPATKGKVIIYLCSELVDLNKKITLKVNGKIAFDGKVQPDKKHMVNSCAAFFDPARLYPAAIEIDLENL